LKFSTKKNQNFVFSFEICKKFPIFWIFRNTQFYNSGSGHPVFGCQRRLLQVLKYGFWHSGLRSSHSEHLSGSGSVHIFGHPFTGCHFSDRHFFPWSLVQIGDIPLQSEHLVGAGFGQTSGHPFLICHRSALQVAPWPSWITHSAPRSSQSEHCFIFTAGHSIGHAFPVNPSSVQWSKKPAFLTHLRNGFNSQVYRGIGQKLKLWSKKSKPFLNERNFVLKYKF